MVPLLSGWGVFVMKRGTQATKQAGSFPSSLTVHSYRSKCSSFEAETGGQNRRPREERWVLNVSPLMDSWHLEVPGFFYFYVAWFFCLKTRIFTPSWGSDWVIFFVSEVNPPAIGQTSCAANGVNDSDF